MVVDGIVMLLVTCDVHSVGLNFLSNCDFFPISVSIHFVQRDRVSAISNRYVCMAP